MSDYGFELNDAHGKDLFASDTRIAKILGVLQIDIVYTDTQITGSVTHPGFQYGQKFYYAGQLQNNFDGVYSIAFTDTANGFDYVIDIQYTSSDSNLQPVIIGYGVY